MTMMVMRQVPSFADATKAIENLEHQLEVGRRSRPWLRRPVRRGYDGERLKTLKGFAAEAVQCAASARSTASTRG